MGTIAENAKRKVSRLVKKLFRNESLLEPMDLCKVINMDFEVSKCEKMKLINSINGRTNRFELQFCGSKVIFINK